MKRLLIIVLLLFAGVVVALPGAIGLVTERQHDQIVGQINARGNQLAEEQYERGWFSTRTRHRYRIDNGHLRKLATRITGEPEGKTELLVYSEIYHGPLPVISGGPDRAVLAWTDTESTLVLRAPSGTETPLPGQLHSRIEADGTSRFRYHADAETRPVRDGLALSWNDADIDIVLGRNAETLSVNGDIGLLRLTDPTATVQIGPVVVTSAQRLNPGGLWTGQTAIRIDSVSLPGFDADELLLETRLEESSGQATYALALKTGSLQVHGFTGDSAEIDFFARRLDARALGELMQLASESPGQFTASRRDPLLRQLLAAGPEMTLRKLQVPMTDANIDGEAFVSIDPDTGDTISELSRRAKGNATLLVPKSLVTQIAAGATPQIETAIDLMMQLRVLKPEGNRYRIEAAYAGGLLTVNGFPVPLPRF